MRKLFCDGFRRTVRDLRAPHVRKYSQFARRRLECHLDMFARLMGLEVVSPGGLHQMIQTQGVTVIDVNSHQSWMKARVPSALNLDPANYNESDLPPNKESSLVFYCSNPLCRKAPNADRRAKKMGYSNIKVLSAGISGWLAAKLPTEGAA